MEGGGGGGACVFKVASCSRPFDTSSRFVGDPNTLWGVSVTQTKVAFYFHASTLTRPLLKALRVNTRVGVFFWSGFRMKPVFRVARGTFVVDIKPAVFKQNNSRPERRSKPPPSDETANRNHNFV